MRCPPFTTTMNLFRRAPTRTPKAGTLLSQYVICALDWGRLLMLISVRFMRGIPHWPREIRHSNRRNERCQGVAKCLGRKGEKEVKQRHTANMVRYAGVVQWQNISFPS